MTHPRAPAHLSEASRKLFRSILSSFDLRDDELELLDLALTALDRAHQARARLDVEGITLAGLHGDRTHPCVAIERSSALTAAKLLRQLGLHDADLALPGRPEVVHGGA